MTSEEVAARWPVLAAAVTEAGVRAFHAEPLHVRDRAVGCLNMYSADPAGVDIPDPDVLTVLTEYLVRGLTDFSAAQSGEAGARRLQDMLRTRFVVNQAVGILMASEGIGEEAARLSLYQTAAEQGLPVADAAAELVVRRGAVDPAELGGEEYP